MQHYRMQKHLCHSKLFIQSYIIVLTRIVAPLQQLQVTLILIKQFKQFTSFLKNLVTIKFSFLHNRCIITCYITL